MNYRVTPQVAMNSAVRQAQNRQTSIAELQEQLSTGLRISKPSDSPAEWGTLIGRKATIDRMEVEIENIEVVRQTLNQSVSSLTGAGNVLVRARELALASHQSQSRETLAQEVDLLIDHLLEIANTASAGVQLYGGTASAQAPFAITGTDENGRPTSIEYQGSGDASLAAVSRYTTSDVLSSGGDVFQQSTRQKTEYIGNTGATAGIGTDNVSGTETLSVRHLETIYASAIVSPGASTSDDTIIGPSGSHKLTIGNDPDLGRVVSLNDGGTQPFDQSDVDLRVVGSQGQRVHVDLSSVPIGFTGVIEIEANGTVSVDGGQTVVPVEFSESQVLTFEGTDRVTVIDSSQIRQAGDDRIEYTGTNGAFESLIQLRDDLRDSQDWSTDEFVAIMSARLEDVERAHSQIMDFVGEQSVELSNLDRLESKTRELRLVAQESVAETENADVAEVISQMQNQQIHLQFIYASAASMNQVSLLDFIS